MLRKVELLKHAKAHYAADMLVKGIYGTGYDHFKGCSVGCFLHSLYPDKSSYEIRFMGDKHKRVAEGYGYPEWLVHLQDAIFEGLPNGESAKWHVQLVEKIAALPDEPDWQRILHRVHAGILRIALRTAGTAQEVVQRVIDLHERAAKGEDISDDLWSAAERSAVIAVWSGAERSAVIAAWSAKWSAVASAEESAAYQEIRDAVLEAIAA